MCESLKFLLWVDAWCQLAIANYVGQDSHLSVLCVLHIVLNRCTSWTGFYVYLQGRSCSEGHGDRQIKGVWICVLLQQTGKALAWEHRLQFVFIFLFFVILIPYSPTFLVKWFNNWTSFLQCFIKIVVFCFSAVASSNAFKFSTPSGTADQSFISWTIEWKLYNYYCTWIIIWQNV